MNNKMIFTVICMLLLSLTQIANSFPYFEGVSDGDRIVVGGIDGEISTGTRFAFAVGEFESEMDTVYIEGFSPTTFGNIRYEKSSDSYIVSGSRYVSPEPYLTYLLRLDKDLKIIDSITISSEIITEYTNHNIDPDGNIYVVGLRGNDGGNSNDYFLTKFSPELEPLWEKAYGTPGNNDYGKDIAYDNGGLVMIGEGVNDLTGTLDPIVRKIDTDGNIIWELNIGDPDTYDGCQELFIDSNGDYLIIGENPVLPEKIFQFIVARVSPEGTLKHLSYHGSQLTNDAGFSIRETDFGYITVGYSDDYTDGYTKRAACMIFDKNLNFVQEFLYPDSQGHAMDIVEHKGRLYALGMAIQSENMGMVWDISEISSIVDMQPVARELSAERSYIIDPNSWNQYIDMLLAKSETNNDGINLKLYNLLGQELASGLTEVRAIVPRAGIYFLTKKDFSSIVRVTE